MRVTVDIRGGSPVTLLHVMLKIRLKISVSVRFSMGVGIYITVRVRRMVTIEAMCLLVYFNTSVTPC